MPTKLETTRLATMDTLFLDIEPYLANESIEVVDIARAQDDEYYFVPSKANDPKIREHIMNKSTTSA